MTIGSPYLMEDLYLTSMMWMVPSLLTFHPQCLIRLIKLIWLQTKTNTHQLWISCIQVDQKITNFNLFPLVHTVVAPPWIPTEVQLLMVEISFLAPTRGFWLKIST